MTCREKLKLEHPECIDDDELGGCTGCPWEYGYLADTDDACRVTEEGCRECWDREISGTEPAKKPTENSTPAYPVKKATDDYIDPIHITIHTNLVDSPEEVIAEVFKYVYTIKDRTVNISIQ